MEEKINNVLDKIRPRLNEDNGDIEFIKYEDGIVLVKLVGMCAYCPHKQSTLQDLILGMLQSEIPEITDIVNVDL